MTLIKLQKLINLRLLSLILAFPGFGLAGESETTEPPVQQEYLTADKMTREDRDMLAQHSENYNYCLSNTSIEQMQLQPDPRHVVDIAMKQCAVELENLDKKMIERNFDPVFRQGYLRRVSNHGANQTLRMVMMTMANRPEQSEPVPAAPE